MCSSSLPAGQDPGEKKCVFEHQAPKLHFCMSSLGKGFALESASVIPKELAASSSAWLWAFVRIGVRVADEPQPRCNFHSLPQKCYIHLANGLPSASNLCG